MATVPLSPPRALALPRSAQRFHSDDLDEVREFAERFAGPHSRVVQGTGPVGFEQRWLATDAVMAGWAGIGLASTVRGAVRVPTLHIVLNGGAEYRFGRRRLSTGPGMAMFVPPGSEYTTHRLPGTMFGLAVDHAPFVAELAAREPFGRGVPVLRAHALTRAALERHPVGAAIAAYLRAAAHDAGMASARTRLVGALADLLRDEGAAGHGTDVAASRLADVEAWIDANLEAPISVGRLCAVAGVGERALQKSFESRRGMSPMRFVTERRLAAVHRELTEAGTRDDVTGIAMRLGFDHTGRFAALYRQAYGESPSQTLRRSRR